VLFGQQSPSPTTSGTALIETLSSMDQDFHTEFSWDFHGFPEVSASFCHVNPPKNSPKSVPMVSPKMTDQPEGNHEKTSKDGLVQKSRTPKNPIRKHTNTHTQNRKNTRCLPQELQTLPEILQLLASQLIHFDPARQVSQQATEQVSWAGAERVPGGHRPKDFVCHLF
jgi:hypothetical protein